MAPMPVHAPYAVPRGNERIENPNKAKLMTMSTTVAMEGPSRVNPSDSFIDVAQPTSNNPAMMSAIQANVKFPSACLIR